MPNTSDYNIVLYTGKKDFFVTFTYYEKPLLVCLSRLFNFPLKKEEENHRYLYEIDFIIEKL